MCLTPRPTPSLETESQDSECAETSSSWDAAAKLYDVAVGPSTTKAASRLIEMAHSLQPLDTERARVIDFGAGTGALTHALIENYPDLSILASDISPQMLEGLRARLPDDKSNVVTQVLDMQHPFSDQTPESSFSHIFSTMALQLTEKPGDPETGALVKWLKLLKPGGVLAIAIWELDPPFGPLDIWDNSACAADSKYTPFDRAAKSQLYGRSQLEAAMKRIGCEEMQFEGLEIGFNVGSGGYMSFVWESGNPYLTERIASYHGDVDALKREMRRILHETYEDGWNIPMYAALAVARKPLEKDS